MFHSINADFQPIAFVRLHFVLSIHRLAKVLLYYYNSSTLK